MLHRSFFSVLGSLIVLTVDFSFHLFSSSTSFF